VQSSAGLNAITIQFREFGVRLKFTPNILSDGTIRLKVAPEVSSLDFSNALTISGFLVPALSTRRAETEVELRDGQSFAIAGLLDNRLTTIASKVPGLGDIPILGKLFRSRSNNRSNTELLVMVTPRLVRPLAPGQVPPLPTFPKPFLDKERFDGKMGETPPPVKKNNP
jgi:pilus assembly protein CpaC